MTLLEQSEAVAAEIVAVVAARTLAEQVQAVTTRTRSFNEAAGLIDAALGRAGALRARGLEVPKSPAPAQTVRRNLKKWREAKTADPAAVISAGPQTVQTEILAPAKRIAQTLEAVSKEVWRRHALSRLPKVDNETLKLLGDLPGQGSQVAAFRHDYDRTLTLAETVPSTDAEFERFDHFARQCDAGWRGLDAADLPASVRRFLREAGSPAGAGLPAFDDEVRVWLERHGWTGKFRIRSR